MGGAIDGKPSHESDGALAEGARLGGWLRHGGTDPEATNATRRGERRPPGLGDRSRGRGDGMTSPEQRNYEQIERLQQLLAELRAGRSTARETEAIREIGLEIAVAIREVGAMLVDVGWEQSYAAGRAERSTRSPER